MLKSLLERFTFSPSGNYTNTNKDSWFRKKEINQIPLIFGIWNSKWGNTIEEDKGIILYFHGVYGNLKEEAETLAKYANKLNCNLVALEYPGYGETHYRVKQTPTEENTRERGLLLYNYIAKEYPNCPIYLMGVSLGSGIAVYLSTLPQNLWKFPRGVILIAPYLSIISIFSHRIALFLPWIDIFPNYKNIDKIQVPIFILHGKKDKVVSPNHSRKMYRSRNNTEDVLILIDEMGHEELITNDEMFNELNAFLKI